MEFSGKFSNIDMYTILRRGKNINKPKKSWGTMLLHFQLFFKFERWTGSNIILNFRPLIKSVQTRQSSWFLWPFHHRTLAKNNCLYLTMNEGVSSVSDLSLLIEISSFGRCLRQKLLTVRCPERTEQSKDNIILSERRRGNCPESVLAHEV